MCNQYSRVLILIYMNINLFTYLCYLFNLIGSILIVRELIFCLHELHHFNVSNSVLCDWWKNLRKYIYIKLPTQFCKGIKPSYYLKQNSKSYVASSQSQINFRALKINNSPIGCLRGNNNYNWKDYGCAVIYAYNFGNYYYQITMYIINLAVV